MDTSYVTGQKYIWRLPSKELETVADIARTHNLSYPIAQTLLTRGFSDPEHIRSFLFPSFEIDVGDPVHLKDAEKSVERILHAIAHKEKILIFGDYDVDGITSSALMMIALLPIGAHVNFFLPHRVRDGYGLSTKIVERAAQNGYKLIITVDNGITAFEPALRAKQLGIDLIITDHHRPHEAVPDAFAIVNPNQNDCSYAFKKFAGVGVVFKILTLLYAKKGLSLPSKAYELLLLGTIADVVPLIGENRFWARYGLSYINSVESVSFQVLKKNGKLTKSRINSLDIGFSVAPQINALGRLEDPRRGVQFLIGADVEQVREVGAVLSALNETRKEVERAIYQDVMSQIEAKNIDLSKDFALVAVQKGWQPGVIGLVASRLVSAYGKPTILLHLTKDGIAKGSCRSIPEFNMFDALQSAQHLLLQFGGHSQAAGLSLHEQNIPTLKEHLNERISRMLTSFDLQQKISIDAYATLPDLTMKIVHDIAQLEPFGNENPYPTFMIQRVVLIDKPKLLKDAHVKCSIFADGVIKPVIFFNRPELYAMLSACDRPFDIAAQVQENHWNGRVNIELQGIDISLQDNV